MLKSDKEAAILALSINGLRQVMSEHFPGYDPQANGAAENEVKAWKGMFRTQKSSLECSIAMKVPVRRPLT